jgi:DNA-binding CsgD family transcriptional regulator
MSLPLSEDLAGLLQIETLNEVNMAILDSIKDPIGIYEKNYILLWINKALAESINSDAMSSVGKTCFKEIWKRESPCNDCPIRSVFKDGKSHVKEKLIKVPGKETRWCEVHSYPIIGRSKGVSSVIAYSIDITEKKKNNQKKKEYLEFLTKKMNNTELNKTIELGDDDIEINVYLSNRETEVLRLLPEGYTNRQISEFLSISPNTVKTHVNSIFNKMGVNDRTMAAVLATRYSLV